VLINEALNEIAPIKTFKFRSSYKFGLSVATKELMKNRDQTRKEIKVAGNQEKLTLQEIQASQEQIDNPDQKRKHRSQQQQSREAVVCIRFQSTRKGMTCFPIINMDLDKRDPP
jgi:hypothetical protein